MTTTMTDDDFHAALARDQLVASLHDLLAAALPHQWIAPAIDAVLSDTSPLVTPADHNAAVKREVDWQAHWVDKCQQLEVQVSRLEAQLDRTRAERVAAVLALTDMPVSRTATHDDTCHLRHAGCLAAKVRGALLGGPR